jgi:hypothetical protein
MASILRNFPEFVMISDRLDKLEEMHTQQTIEFERIRDDMKMVLETLEKVSLATKTGFSEIREVVESYIDEPEVPETSKVDTIAGYIMGAVSVLIFAVGMNVFTYATTRNTKWLPAPN